LVAVSMYPMHSSKIHIVSSTYPLVNALLTYFIFSDPLNLHYLIIGALMIIFGSVMVATS
jgi:drug/metabolite transporter (DMT)-like permease